MFANVLANLPLALLECLKTRKLGIIGTLGKQYKNAKYCAYKSA